MIKPLNVLSLFDGISGGRLALQRANIPIANYFASEIDKHAIKVTQTNFPDTIQLGDMTKWESWKLPKIDILFAGFPCFTGDTLIKTIAGYVPISEIKEGNRVLTHTGLYQKVVNFNKKLAPVVTLKGNGILPTKTTLNHPYYVREMSRVGVNEKRTRLRVLSDPMWKEVKDLKKGDFLGVPILKEENNNPYNLTEELCWIIGRYIADGHLIDSPRKGRKNSNAYKVVLSVGKSKVDEVKEKIISYHTTISEKRTATNFIICSKELVNLFHELELGRGAKNKNISDHLLNLPNNLLKEVLNGYLSGDGYYDSRAGLYKATTISKKLALSLQLAIQKCYRVGVNMNFFKRPPTAIIEGRIVNQNDTYSIGFYPEEKPQSHYIVDDDFIWYRFREVVDSGEVLPVFNMEVENDNSYTAENAVVHNCQAWSMSGKMQGDKDPRGALVHDLIALWRFLQELNPNMYFVFENVKMKKEFIDYINKLFGVKPIEINSSLVSAQNRKRLYWTNIPGIKQPKDKGIVIKDLIAWSRSTRYPKDGESYVEQRSTITGKSNTLTTGDGCGSFSSRNLIFSTTRRENTRTVKKSPNEKAGCLTASYYKGLMADGRPGISPEECVGMSYSEAISNGFRMLTPEECEFLQTLPRGYTSGISNTQRYKSIGNGWTVDVVAHILKYIHYDNEKLFQ